tara:strand:- start:1917 stop:2090 length:174 start_codon:yes stop_codon:yes gene_type:complete
MSDFNTVKALKALLMTSEHIGFMQSEGASEYKVLELRDSLEEMVLDFLINIEPEVKE